ncbi:MAG: BON domain-containing protein [Flavisolibacter sp.]
MKTDFEIQREINALLRLNPLLTSSEVGVAVKNGIVMLSGEVDSYSEKLLSVELAKTVSDVKAIVERIEIVQLPGNNKTDFEMADRIVKLLRANPVLQPANIKVIVEDGFITLLGDVKTPREKQLAGGLVQNLVNPLKVFNDLVVKVGMKAA